MFLSPPPLVSPAPDPTSSPMRRCGDGLGSLRFLGSLRSPGDGDAPASLAVRALPLLLLAGLLLSPTAAAAQDASGNAPEGATVGIGTDSTQGIPSGELRPIGHEAYEIWNSIGSRAISADGSWVLHTLSKEDGDDELVVRGVRSGVEHRIERGASPTFADDDRRVVFRIQPRVEAVREARSNRGGDPPRDSLGILDLNTGDRTTIPLVQRFSVSPGDDRFLAVHLRPEADQAPGEGEDTKEEGTLVLWDLQTGEQAEHWYATGFEWAPTGNTLLAALSPPDDAGAPAEAGLFLLDVSSGDMTPVMETRGTFTQLTFDRESSRVAFLHGEENGEGSSEGESGGNGAPWTLFHWSPDAAAPTAVTSTAGEGLQDGWGLSEFGSLTFSEDGSRLFFGTRPDPIPMPEDRPRLEAEVDVDVWHWQDGDLMTVQRVRETQERRRSYTAVHFLDDDRIVQLADEDLPNVNVGRDGDGARAVGTSTGPYAISASWESPNFRDAYLVEVTTGDRTLLAERSQANPSLSPDERYVTWYEPGDSTWYALELESGTRTDLGEGIPHPLWNESHDSPSPAGSYGNPGWLDGTSAFLLYDQFDLWAVDPTDPGAARNVTGGAGRSQGIRYRLLQLDTDADGWASSETALASAFDTRTKDAGFARIPLGGSGAPSSLLMEPRRFSNPVKAADADRLLFTQETFRDFPDLWVSDLDFAGRTQVSDANPQQAEYRWGNAELVRWTSLDGHALDGILLTPDDFDPTREYPMVVYFYDRSSDGLHSHVAPIPHRSRINFPMYTSDGYVVFIPDIVYRVGYPGEGAFNAILPGVTSLIDQGFVDRERIALQGHSWGGYQIAFMITRSERLFRAAAAGAPVANMTSAYGGIRWETGLVRQFQYERTQSRLGASLWDAPMRYIENSPLFWVDKIETPLLIMHNDSDGHVPWEQGIELFTAMRRLSKPAWLINYPGEPHWPTTFANKRDWNIRMKQFFDHFLKDEPAPVWMVDGIPAVRRGETLGYEPVPGAVVTDPDGR